MLFLYSKLAFYNHTQKVSELLNGNPFISSHKVNLYGDLVPGVTVFEINYSNKKLHLSFSGSDFDSIDGFSFQGIDDHRVICKYKVDGFNSESYGMPITYVLKRSNTLKEGSTPNILFNSKVNLVEELEYAFRESPLVYVSDLYGDVSCQLYQRSQNH